MNIQTCLYVTLLLKDSHKLFMWSVLGKIMNSYLKVLEPWGFLDKHYILHNPKSKNPVDLSPENETYNGQKPLEMILSSKPSNSNFFMDCLAICIDNSFCWV